MTGQTAGESEQGAGQGGAGVFRWEVLLSRIGKDAPNHPGSLFWMGRGDRDAHINGAPFPPLSWPESNAHRHCLVLIIVSAAHLLPASFITLCNTSIPPPDSVTSTTRDDLVTALKHRAFATISPISTARRFPTPTASSD